MDYSNEPPHSELLEIQAHQPFNAEPPSSSLVEFQITPEELVYCRNHGPVRTFPEDEYVVEIHNLNGTKNCLSLPDIKKTFTKTRVVAALQVSYFLSPLEVS